ncbi:response regulator transcription factor [bacterium]|nr:MAG: response regulator transcription factor [bacterium]
MIRVMVVDDHNLVRQGIEAILEKAHDMELVGSAEDGQQALDVMARVPADVVVADIAMPRLNGIQMMRGMAKSGSQARVVILSMYSDETLVRQALKCGACGYLLKSSVTEELLLAVRAAYRGKVYISPEVSRAVLDDFPTASSGGSNFAERLTSREGQVLQLVAEGHSNTEIGNILSLSAKTVEKHRATMMKKLGASDLPSLIRIAMKHRLIFPED